MSIDETKTPDQTTDEPHKHWGNRIFFFFLVLGFLILAGCIFQNKKAEPNTNASSTTSANDEEDLKNGYTGKIVKTPAGSQYDDYLKTADAEYGLDAVAEPIIAKIIELRGSEKEVIVWGELSTDVPDYGGQQILVNKIEVPSDNFSLAWEVYKNEKLGVSLQHPKKTKLETSDNALVFDGWELEFLNNPKHLNFKEWANANFAESKEKPCNFAPTADIIIGDWETYEVSIGEGDKCQKLGIFAMSPDKQKVVKLLLTDKPDKNFRAISKTLRFIKTLPKDEVDINESNKNGQTPSKTGIANPASVYCEEQGGKLEIRTDKRTASQYGACVFSDGSECEEWAYYRGECVVDK